jgi:hypothetical protein
MKVETYNMERKALEGWIVKEIDGKHIFANRPHKVRLTPNTSESWVGYDIDYNKWLSQALDDCELNDLDHIRITIEVEKI